MAELTVDALISEARAFAEAESVHDEPTLYGVTDGKALGTYLERRFRAHLAGRYDYQAGSSARGVDFPHLQVDMKVTSVRQPQSSCPFESARQKVFGLGYSLLVFVYEKSDDNRRKTGRLRFEHVIFVEESRTADFQTTMGLLEILRNDGNKDDLVAFMSDRMLPGDEISLGSLAEEVLRQPPLLGSLTISNALQWRLQYGRAINEAGSLDGVVRIT